jgi:hypothetical protein
VRQKKESQPVRTNGDLYNSDFYAWTQEQAALLRNQKAQNLDYTNLAEEIESLGKSQQHALENRLEVVLTHLLKWRYCPMLPDARRGWRLTIREQRRRLARLLHQNPSLHPTVPAIIAESYPHARLMALDDTEVPSTTFPEMCPWTLEQVLDAEFWPEGETSAPRRMGFSI